jgi:hypothetical protein
VRAHDVCLYTSLDNGDGTFTLTNEKVVILKVDSTHEAGELNAHGHGFVHGIDAVDLAVLAAREELAVGETQGRDEALAMEIHGALTFAAIVTTPNVDLGVGATCVGLTLVAPGDTGEGGHLVTVEETLLLVASRLSRIPEVDVLHTSSCESCGSLLSVPADVVDLVGITLLLEHNLAFVIVKVNTMFVVESDSSDAARAVDGDSDDTTGALADLDSPLFLTGG